jgi:CHAT domain-containing protein/Tfp pilus assembly protein PilF
MFRPAVLAMLLVAAAPTEKSESEKLPQLFEAGDLVSARKIAFELVAAKANRRDQGADFAIVCANAALLHDLAGDYERAERLYLSALKTTDRATQLDSGLKHAVLCSLFALYVNTGRSADAEAISHRDPKVGAELDPAAVPTGLLMLTKRGRDWANARSTLANGWISYLHSDTDAALAFAKTATEISRRLEARPSLSDALNLIATVHYKRGEYDQARTIYLEALAVSSASDYIFGNARNWSSLGSTAYRQGDFRIALENYEKSLEARRRLGNKDEIARALNDLANVQQEMGDYERALALREQALALWKETGNQAGRADGLNDLAWVYQSMGNYPKALSSLLNARVLHEKIGDRWGVADDLDGIGLAQFKVEAYEKALEAFGDSLRRFTELGSLEECARVELHLGETLHHLDRLAEAETAFEAALALYEKTFGAGNPRTSETLGDLATVAIDAGQPARAIDLAKRSLAAAQTLLANVLSFTSERQRLEFQKTTDPYSLLATLERGPDLATTLLRNKGIVLDSLLEDRLVAEASNDPRQHEKVARLRTAKQRLMQLSLEAPPSTSADALKKRDLEKNSLATEVEELEAALAREVAGLGRARRALSVTVDQVQAALAPDETLIELVRYQHYLGKTRREPRYGAVLISPGTEPKWIPLGAAAEIEKNIRLYQRTARGQTSEAVCDAVLHALERQIWAPIEKALSDQTKKIVISPDGALNFVSFATLVGEDDRFLSEKYSIRYVASGRDLLRLEQTPPNDEVDVFADPDFGQKSITPATPKRKVSLTEQSVTMQELERLSFPALPGTAREANGLKERAGERARVFLGAGATEKQVRATNSPRVLHLATHGFFLPESDLGRGWSDPASQEKNPKGKLENPMHRSGIALSGAQNTLSQWAHGEVPATEDDGIVTAEEVGGLHLEGTELVVLSACETGSGEVRAGEGVMGLRRGFVQAGARNLLMTLWPISDDTTVQIMFDFYDAVFKNTAPPQALADVQRDWLTKLRKEKGLLAAVRLAGPFIMSSQGTR